MNTGFQLPSVTRRRFALGTALGAAAFMVAPSRALLAAAAQDVEDLTSLGFPELAITVTDSGFEGVPTETAAGRYLLTVTGKTSNGPASVAFVSPTPIGMSAADFADMLAGMAGPPPDAGGGPAASRCGAGRRESRPARPATSP